MCDALLWRQSVETVSESGRGQRGQCLFLCEERYRFCILASKSIDIDTFSFCVADFFF